MASLRSPGSSSRKRPSLALGKVRHMSRLPASYPPGTRQEDAYELEIKPNPWQVNHAEQASADRICGCLGKF